MGGRMVAGGEDSSLSGCPPEERSVRMRFNIGMQAACAVALLFILPNSASISSAQFGSHTGPVESAIVGIEVVNTTKDGAAQQVRRGNGLIIRCDGFVLAPGWLFSKTVTVGGQT